MATVAHDFSPFYRASVGFDRLFDMLNSAAHEAGAHSYPPYNIEKTDENAYRISIAVAGFKEDELSVEVNNRTLLVTGKKTDKGGDRHYLHRGIATRDFERRFQLAEHVVVTGASLQNGLLNIDLRREIPEELKPRKIRITNGAGNGKVIEGETA